MVFLSKANGYFTGSKDLIKGPWALGKILKKGDNERRTVRDDLNEGPNVDTSAKWDEATKLSVEVQILAKTQNSWSLVKREIQIQEAVVSSAGICGFC